MRTEIEKVRAWVAREQAAREAWMAPGVYEVANLISVKP